MRSPPPSQVVLWYLGIPQRLGEIVVIESPHPCGFLRNLNNVYLLPTFPAPKFIVLVQSRKQVLCRFAHLDASSASPFLLFHLEKREVENTNEMSWQVGPGSGGMVSPLVAQRGLDGRGLSATSFSGLGGGRCRGVRALFLANAASYVSKLREGQPQAHWDARALSGGAKDEPDFNQCNSESLPATTGVAEPGVAEPVPLPQHLWQS